MTNTNLDLIKYHNLDPDISAEELKALFPFIVESVETDPIQRVKLQAAILELQFGKLLK